MNDNPNTTPATTGTPKRPYQKPAFRHEPVFETLALTCSTNPQHNKVGNIS
jgi:hypothetical protein